MPTHVSIYAGIPLRSGRNYSAFQRYVAFLDILGMKSWLGVSPADEIASTLDLAFAAMDADSRGQTPELGTFGPVIGSTQFSDSILLWSPDDSWTSL